MPFGETKVYFDGSHYIAIPHTTRPTRKRPKPPEEIIEVLEENEIKDFGEPESSISLNDIENDNNSNQESVEMSEDIKAKTPLKTRHTTRKQLFEALYTKYINLHKSERKNRIIKDMLPYFKDEKHCKDFVETNFDRKQRNLICRRVRMARKANLANFNYFCTFTYDDKLHTEQTFKKKLQTCFRNLCYRNNWKYMGVWERAPNTNRLHFHGLFYIPKDKMVGEIIQVKDFDTKAQRMQTSFQSTYFNEKFGRSDFKEIEPQERILGNALAYLMKYIEKTGEKIVYSKGLPQYFISDIMDDDVVCRIGQEDKKLLLFDDFNCWDEGCLMGKVSPEVIEQMRKSN